MQATTSGEAGQVDSKVTLKAQMNVAFSLREKDQLRNPTKQFQDSMATVPLDKEASKLFLSLNEEQQKIVITALAQQGITVKSKRDKVSIIGGHDLAAVVKNGLLGFPSYFEAGSAKDIEARAERVKEIKKKDIEYSDYFEEKPVDVSVLTKDALYYLHTISKKDKAMSQADFELRYCIAGEEPSDTLKRMTSSKDSVVKSAVTNPTQLNSAQYLEFLSKFEIKSIVMPVQKGAAEDVSSVQQLGNLGVQGACDMHLLYQDKKTGEIYTFAIEREVWTGLESVESKGKVQHPLAIGKLNAIVQKYLATLGGLDEGKAIAGLAKKIVEELFEEGFACNGKFKLSASDSVTTDELTSIQRSPDNHKILEFKNNEWVLTMDITSKEGEDALKKTLEYQFPNDPEKQKRITEFLQKKKSEYQETKAKHVKAITQIIEDNMVSMGMRANVTDDRANARLLPFSEAFRVVLDQSQVSILKELAQSGDDASGLAGFVEFDATKFWSDHGVMQLRSILDACIEEKMHLTPTIIQQCKKMGIALPEDFYTKLSPVSLHVFNEVNNILDATTPLDRSKVGRLVMMLPDIKALDHDLYQQVLKTIEAASHNSALKFTPEQKQNLLLLLSLESSTFEPDKKTLAMIAKQVESGKNELFLKLLDGYRQYPEKPLFKNFDQYIALYTKKIMDGLPSPAKIGELWAATPQTHRAAFLGHYSATHSTKIFSELINQLPDEAKQSVKSFFDKDNLDLYTQIMTTASNPTTKFTTEIFNVLKFVDKDNYATALDNMREAFLNPTVFSAKRDIFLKEMQKAISKASREHQIQLSRMYIHLAYHHEAIVHEYEPALRVAETRLDVVKAERGMMQALKARLSKEIMAVLTDVPPTVLPDSHAVARQLKHLVGDRLNPYQRSGSVYKDSPFLDTETSLLLALTLSNNPAIKKAFEKDNVISEIIDLQKGFCLEKPDELPVPETTPEYIAGVKETVGKLSKNRLILVTCDHQFSDDSSFYQTYGMDPKNQGDISVPFPTREGTGPNVGWNIHCVGGTEGQDIQEIGRTDGIVIPKGHERRDMQVNVSIKGEQVFVGRGKLRTELTLVQWTMLKQQGAVEVVSFRGKDHYFLKPAKLKDIPATRNLRASTQVGAGEVDASDDFETGPQDAISDDKKSELMDIARACSAYSYSFVTQTNGRPNAADKIMTLLHRAGARKADVKGLAGEACVAQACADAQLHHMQAIPDLPNIRFLDPIKGKMTMLRTIDPKTNPDSWKAVLESLLKDASDSPDSINFVTKEVTEKDLKAFRKMLKENQALVKSVMTSMQEGSPKNPFNSLVLKFELGIPISLSLQDLIQIAFKHKEELSVSMKAQLAKLISKNTKQIWGKIEAEREKQDGPYFNFVSDLVLLMRTLTLDANTVKFKSKVERHYVHYVEELEHLGNLLPDLLAKPDHCPHKISCMVNQFLAQAKKHPGLLLAVAKVKESYYKYLQEKASGYLESLCSDVGAENSVDLLDDYMFFISPDKSTVLRIENNKYQTALEEGRSTPVQYIKQDDNWAYSPIKDYEQTFSVFTLFQSAFRASLSKEPLIPFFDILRLPKDLKACLISTTRQSDIGYSDQKEAMGEAIFPLLDTESSSLKDNLESDILALFQNQHEGQPIKQGVVLLSLAAVLAKLSSADFFGTVEEGEPFLRLFSEYLLKSAQKLLGTKQPEELEKLRKRLAGVSSDGLCAITIWNDIQTYLKTNCKDDEIIRQTIVPLSWQE